MSKTRIGVIVGGVISLLLVVLAAAMTISRMGKASTERTLMENAHKTLTGYYNQNPFPSETNISTEAVNLEVIKERYSVLTSAISSNAVVIKGDFSPGAFSTKCEETVDRLRHAAPKGGEPVIAPDFFFGFDRYDRTKEGGVEPARKEDVPRLLRQLAIMEMLVRELYAAKVISIEKALREEFDLEGEARRTGGIIRRTRPTATAGGDAFSFSLGDAPPVEAPFPLDRQRFGFVFLAKEASLLDFLNRIDAMWPYAQISSFTIVKNGEDVVPRAAAEAPSSPTGIKEPPKPRTSRLMSGGLLEAPVRVGVQIDIYTFGASAGGDAAAVDSETGAGE